MKIMIENQEFKDCFQLEEALAKGTLFPSLFEPYKYVVPLPMAGMDKIERTTNILRQLKFGIVELNLYLDTHPGEKKAIDMLNLLSDECKKMTEYYEKNIGTLKAKGRYDNCFTYATEVWPWEVRV